MGISEYADIRDIPLTCVFSVPIGDIIGIHKSTLDVRFVVGDILHADITDIRQIIGF